MQAKVPLFGENFCLQVSRGSKVHTLLLNTASLRSTQATHLWTRQSSRNTTPPLNLVKLATAFY